MADSKNTTKIILAVVAGFGFVLLVCCGAGAWFVGSAYQQVAGTANLPEGVSYSQWRQSFQSQLLTKGPAPQDYDVEEAPPNVTLVTYPSGDLQLKAWVYRPPDSEDPAPALLFLHGGFAFGMGDLMACRAAMDQGFVVMAPALRGENGNPGDFELMLGEVDDAKAAAIWLSQQAYVDRQNIFVFGHSIGGGVSAMLPLLDDVPIRHSGSSGGLYPPTAFLGWSDVAPFRNTPTERMARLLIGNIRHMQRPHHAYLGQQDTLQDAAEMAKKEMGADSRLTIEMVPGDHFSSFEASLERYLDRATSR